MDLTFDLDPLKTRVLNKMTLRRNPDVPVQALRLDGEELNLARVLVNGAGTSFKMDGDQLVLENLPEGGEPVELEIFTTCAPIKNTKLMGLYVSEDTFFTQCEALGFRRITYFLERAVPVAAEHKLKIACHPNDPGMPNGKNWRGVVPVLGRVEGLKRFISIKENPYHGLNFCQGTICEGLENPNKEIHDIIRYFGQKKKIFNVHFRNIEGKIGDFRETFPDNGDVNMIEAIRTYREAGYDGMIMPDHVPHVGGDPRGAKSFALFLKTKWWTLSSPKPKR